MWNNESAYDTLTWLDNEKNIDYSFIELNYLKKYELLLLIMHLAKCFPLSKRFDWYFHSVKKLCILPLFFT